MVLHGLSARIAWWMPAGLGGANSTTAAETTLGRMRAGARDRAGMPQHATPRSEVKITYSAGLVCCGPRLQTMHN